MKYVDLIRSKSSGIAVMPVRTLSVVNVTADINDLSRH